MARKILVVGGYGGVGRTIAEFLSDKLPEQVIVAGRNFYRASQFSAELNQRVLPMQLDIFDRTLPEDLFDDVSMVVMCVDQHDTRFVEACIRRGIDYIDITANYGFLSQLEALDAGAKSSGSTVVLSVGLSPGLTNLLAGYANSQIEAVEHVDIFILLGLGEEHGEAAVRWTVENFNAEYRILDANGSRQVQSFHEGKSAQFPLGLGRRKAYRFGFPDQQVLPGTLGIRSASTWLCFDSALMTNLLAYSERVGILKLLRFRMIQNAFVSMLRRVHLGSDIFVLIAHAYTDAAAEQPSFECGVSGNGEARATGIVAAKVALLGFESAFQSGVFHLEQLIEPPTFFEQLKGEGLSFFEGSPEESLAPRSI